MFQEYVDKSTKFTQWQTSLRERCLSSERQFDNVRACVDAVRILEQSVFASDK